MPLNRSETEGRWPNERASRRWPLLALLAAAHIGLLGLLGSQLHVQRQARVEQHRAPWARLTLWLRPAPSPALERPAERPRREPPVMAAARAPAAPAQDLTPSPTVTPQPPGSGTNTSTTPTTPGTETVPSPGAAGDPTGTRAPLRITLPKAGKPGEFTRFHNPALHDPRSNTRIRLTLEEKMAIALGSVECILEERQPDGSIWRGAGRKVTVAPAIAATGAAAAGSDPSANVTLCVR